MVMVTYQKDNKSLFKVILFIITALVASCSGFPNKDYIKDLKIQVSEVTGIDTTSLEYINNYDEDYFSIRTEYLHIYEFYYSGNADFEYIELSKGDSTWLFHREEENLKTVTESLAGIINEGGALYISSTLPDMVGLVVLHTPNKIWLYDWRI